MEGRSPGSDGLDGAGLGLGIQSAGRGSYPPVPGVSDDTRDTIYGSDGTALHTRCTSGDAHSYSILQPN